MAVIIIDGRVRVTWCNSVANLAAPTASEANGGTRLEQLITPDGLDIKIGTGSVNTSNLGSRFTTARAGRITPEVGITFHHDTVDTAWNLFQYRTTGVLLVRRGIDKETAFASGQPLQVLPLEAGMADEVKPGPDSTHDFMVPFFVYLDPEPRAVIA
ncbi:hypothetical protein FJK98_02485 [Micromonospora sp. HM134]|uniref:phage tail tube protein n=1 Tax=Micromonospora sp. HM134 TaxID=2583243 RepID=UPI001198462A|nr:hypothetical protein [Micromonospora sp. HM134]QDY06169.1 hypothetical protein FJK98_02485 [Micromonospora sp. HM134]